MPYFDPDDEEPDLCDLMAHSQRCVSCLEGQHLNCIGSRYDPDLGDVECYCECQLAFDTGGEG